MASAVETAGWVFLSSGASAGFGKSFLYVETGQIVNIFSFTGHVVPDATSQLCLYGAKAAIDNTQTQGHGWVPTEVFTHGETWISYNFYISPNSVLLIS